MISRILDRPEDTGAEAPVDPDDDLRSVCQKRTRSFLCILAALSAGAGPERALALAQPPFVDAVRQVIELAGHPVWEHPGNSPLGYFIEQDAQKAVLALRTHDEHSVSRRENLALRFEL